jgi:hypothetical protein
MLKSLRRLGWRLFFNPTFTRRRGFAGALILTCIETGEDYSLIPAGFGGFYVTGAGGRYLGSADGYTGASDLIEADAAAACLALVA